MSAGMNVETAWPMCRGPEAYGQATATRTFVMGGARRAHGPDKGFAVARGPCLRAGLLTRAHDLGRLVLAAALPDRDEPTRADPRDAHDDEGDPERGGPHGDDLRRARGGEELVRDR